MKSRKHVLRLCCLPEGNVEERFARWLAQWPTCCVDFSLAVPPTLGHLGTGIAQSARLKLHGKVRGELWLRMRAGLSDNPVDDDAIEFEFAPANVDFRCLVTSWLPQACIAFTPYLAYLACEANLLAEARARREAHQTVNQRHQLAEFQPVTFLSTALCRSSWGLEPSELATRLREACHAETLDTGLFIRMSEEELDDDRLAGVRSKLTKLI